MERNWDTVRELMLNTESLRPNQTVTLKDFDTDEHYNISYHVQLLESAGLVDATISRALGSQATQFHLRSLTWEGHEFLDSIRVQSTWSKVKAVIREKGGVMTFDVIKTVAATLVKSNLA